MNGKKWDDLITFVEFDKVTLIAKDDVMYTELHDVLNMTSDNCS